MNNLFLQVTSLSFFLSNCISISSLQTARTMKAGERNVTIAVATQKQVFKSKDADTAKQDQQNSLEEERLPIMFLGLDQGFGNSFEVGMKINPLLDLVGGNIKYALNDLSTPFATAIGFNYDYSEFTHETNYSSVDGQIQNFTFPFYSSYDFGKNSAIFFTPKLMKRTVDAILRSPEAKTTSSGTTTFLGYSTGFKHGNFIYEYSILNSTGQKKSSIEQFTIGYMLNAENVQHHSQYKKVGL